MAKPSTKKARGLEIYLVSAINPYRPARTAESDAGTTDFDTDPEFRRRPLWITAVRWLLVCGLSAIPSFVVAATEARSPPAAMVIGVLLFACGYTALDHCTASSVIRRKATVSRTLKIAYGTRIAITILFPIAVGLDLVCGLISVGISQAILGSEAVALRSLGGAVFTTIIQGLVLNVVVAAYAVVVHLLQLLALKVWNAIPTG